MRINHLAAIGATVAVSLSTLAWSQNAPVLTARELFHAPAAAKTAPTQPVAQKQTKTPTQPKQVAQQSPRPAQRPMQEFRRNDGTVQIITASYEGGKPLGLRYSVLQSAGGQWVEASDVKTFRSGDSIRVRVESNEDAYLCILARGSSGKWEALFPSKDAGRNNRIMAGEPRVIPSESGKWTFDDKKGQERLFLILSRKPFEDLDQLIMDIDQAGKSPRRAIEPAKNKPVAPNAPVPQPPAPKETMLAQSIGSIDDALVGRLQSRLISRDLVFERVDENTKPAATVASPEKEKAAYVVDKSGRPDARVFADIKLMHQ
ncbi:MAG: DUF4384 domain-containing protein [Acidobacteria bacterium]|nr:DUF4384 domain-containing protein [Acidobacteriota bacterium]